MATYTPSFMDNEHQAFYNSCLARLPDHHQDTYHRALFYALGCCEDCRRNIDKLYNFEGRSIRLAALRDKWQTGTSLRVTRLAFNLFNGFCGKGVQGEKAAQYSPYELFDYAFDLQPFMLEAIRVKFPVPSWQ